MGRIGQMTVIPGAEGQCADRVRSMPGWGDALPLVGRECELGRLRAFVDDAAVHGGALVVAGEAGKTALLDAAARHAAESGIRVLRASGVEFEAEASPGFTS